MTVERALYELEDLLSILPHRPPFLFVDRVLNLEPKKCIMAERTLRADEPQFAGHFPGRPIMPGVLIAEALAQASGLLIGLSEKLTSGERPERPRMFFLAATGLKFTHPCAPPATLVLRSELERSFSDLFLFKVEASAGRHLVATGTLTLASVGGQS